MKIKYEEDEEDIPENEGDDDSFDDEDEE